MMDVLMRRAGCITRAFASSLLSEAIWVVLRESTESFGISNECQGSRDNRDLVDLRPRRDHRNMLPAPRSNTEYIS